MAHDPDSRWNQSKAEICGIRVLKESSTWPMTQIAVGAALGRDSVQVHSGNQPRLRGLSEWDKWLVSEPDMCLFLPSPRRSRAEWSRWLSGVRATWPRLK